MTQKIVPCFLITIIGFLLAGTLTLADNPPPGTVVPPVIRVGIYNNKPMAFMDDAGRPQGIFVDVLANIAKQEGWTLEYVPCEWTACLQMLRNDDIDLLGVIGWSAEREKEYDFTQQTLITNWGQIYTARGTDINSFLDLNGKRIAVLGGDIHYTKFKELSRGFGVSPIYIETQNYADVFKLLDEHSVDAGLVNRMYGAQFEDEHRLEESPIILNPIEVRYAAPKGRHQDVLGIIDAHLKVQKDDSNSAYHRALSRWLESSGSSWWRVPDWLIWGFSGALLLLALFMGLNLVLRAQVRAKTAELSAQNEKLRHEVSERRHAEESLRRNQARLELALEATGIGLWQWLADENTLVWDEGCRRIFDFDQNRMPVTPDDYLKIIHPDDQSAVVAAFAACVKRPGQTGHVEFRVYMPDGTLRWVHSTGKGIAGDNGRATQILGGVINTTERRALEDQLRQSQKMEAVGRLAGGVAHDFNNILTAIIGYSDLVLFKLDEADHNYSLISEIKAAGERAAALTRQLLAFSRKQMLQPEQLDLNEIVSNLQKMLRRLIGEDIDLQTSLDPALSLIKADPGQIEQVIMNLAVNARDAMSTGGTLLLETKNAHLDEAYAQNHAAVSPGAYVMLAVSDTGIGMDNATLEHIFEPFFTTKEMGKGTGLGLATVHGIIQQSKGHIWVYSEPGQGSTFKIYLPQLTADEPSSGAEQDAATQDYRGTETILLVEDESSVRGLAQKILESYGYTVFTAKDGTEAMTIAQTRAGFIDLLLTDMIMPGGISGYDLTASFSVMNPQAKIIYMSGYTDNIVVNRGMLEPGTAFLQKPFSSDKLMQKIRGTLDTATG